MRRILLPLAIAGALLVAGGVLSRTMTTDRAAFPSDADAPENPFPACPASPNCVRLTRVYTASADQLFAAVRAAAEQAGQIEREDAPGETGRRTLRVACSALGFTDDLDLAVEPHGEGAALHVRSASRVGYSDFGANGRRVQKLLAAVDAAF